MTPKAQQALADPQFYTLPPAEQQKALAMVDKDYAGLPLDERNKVLQMGQQKLGTASKSPAAPVPPKQLPSQEGFLSSLAAPFVGAAEGLKSAFYEGPQNPQEAAIVGANEKDPSWQSPILGRAILAAKRILVDPQVDQGRQAASEFKQANAESPWYSMHPSPKAAEHRELSLGHGLAAAMPMLGPWAAQVGQKEGEQLGTGNYTGAAGTAFGNAALALTPKTVGKIKALVPGTVRRGEKVGGCLVVQSGVGFLVVDSARHHIVLRVLVDLSGALPDGSAERVRRLVNLPLVLIDDVARAVIAVHVHHTGVIVGV